MKVASLITLFVTLLSTLSGLAESRAGRGVPQSVREEIASTLTVQEAKLGGTTTNQYSFFGWSVAVSGDTVVVGAPGFIGNQGNSQPGAAYVFVEPAGGWQNMIQTAQLSPSDNSALEGFGFSVAIAGDIILVGGPGQVFLYVKPPGGWQNMTETAILQDQSTVSPDGFGSNVAIDSSGDTIVVTAPDSNAVAPNGGAAFVFLEPRGGWQTTRSSAAMLTASDDAEDDNWGDSVAIADSGGTIVIGAPFTPLTVNYGAAYVYVEPKSGWADATETAKLTASKQVANAELGYSLSATNARARSS